MTPALFLIASARRARRISFPRRPACAVLTVACCAIGAYLFTFI